MIKFKFKTSLNDKYFLKIKNKDRKEYKTKLNFKKKIFNKIINWFNLFDDYISYVKDNSTLSDVKSILEDYSNLNSESNEYILETQSSFMFRINIQRCDFLKGKFSLACKNYNDALFFFIRGAKKKSLVIDGLIKKKSLKHIYKLLKKLEKKYEILQLKNLRMEKELKDYKKNKKKIIKKKLSIIRKPTGITKDTNFRTFGEELEIIKSKIFEDIEECNAKQEKDIIILIDFNIYNKEEDNMYAKTYKIDEFIEQTIIILNKYLSKNDRLGVFIYTNKYQIICPLMIVNEIDINNFSKDLLYYKNSFLNETNDTEEYDINSDEFISSRNNKSENSKEDSFEYDDNEEKNNNIIKGLVEAINFLNAYLKMKEGIKNEKYIIVFTEMFNIFLDENDWIEKYMQKIEGDKEIKFLLVGKSKKLNLIKKINQIENSILNKFGDESEVINFENMKKIKAILSNNNVIKEEIIYPNEIYK